MKYPLIAVMFAASLASSSGQNIVNFTSVYGSSNVDIGTSLTITGLGINDELVITSRSIVDSSSPSDPNASAGYEIAHLVWDGDSNPYKTGMGVQPEQGSGSTGISGGGGDQDEEMTFTYSNGGVSLDSISLTINDLKSKDDDPIMWIYTTAGQFLIDEAAIFGAGTANVDGAGASEAADSWTIDFAGFAGIVGGTNETVTSFTLREPTGHTFIKATEFGTAVPEPGSALLAGFASSLMLLRRKR